MTFRLEREFFARNTIEVAKELLGKKLIFKDKSGLITETEAYRGIDDEACHANRGKTARNAVMFGEAGYTYIYFIYGMYFCLNFVTESIGEAGAVLIRGLLSDKLYNGPGKLCRYLNLTREHNGIDLINCPFLYVENTDFIFNYKSTPRIGISKAKEKLWRFVIE